MSEILIDAIGNVTVAAGLVRVDCVAVGPNNQQRPSGTLLIPGPQAGAVLTALVNAMKELQRKQQEQTAPAGGHRFRMVRGCSLAGRRSNQDGMGAARPSVPRMATALPMCFGNRTSPLFVGIA